MPRMYFHKFKTVCSVIFLGKVSADKEYLGEFLGYDNKEKIHILARIVASLYFIYVFVWPFLDLCIFVISLFITVPLGIMQVCLINISFVFLIALIYCGMFLALSCDVGVKKELYACDCSLSKDIHWSIDQCKLRYLNKDDYKKFLYPGQITEVKLDDIHDRYGNYIHRLDKEK